MQTLQEIAQTKLKQSKPASTSPYADEWNRVQQIKMLMNDYSSWIPSHLSGWFYYAFDTLGLPMTHRLIAEAKADGKNQERLFAHLLKKHLAARKAQAV